MDSDRLRLAMQRSGRLSDASFELLSKCGLHIARSRTELFCRVQELPIDLLLVRDDDIPGLIDSGLCDLGIVGRNVLAEQSSERDQAGQPANFREWRALGFGGCKLSLAVPNEWDITDWSGQGPAQLQGKRIATSYPALTRAWLREQNVDADVVVLNGSVEIAPRLGQADVVCDLVSSGATLSANQLKPVRDLHGPKLDSGLSALVEDLHARGMLQDTLVLAIGEFGRSPRMGVSTSGNGNAPDGRDHWPYCYTALATGAGIGQGKLYGKSDAHGSAPVDSPVHPIELLATIYHGLGIDPATEVLNHLNQPRPLVDAKPVLGLFA